MDKIKYYVYAKWNGEKTYKAFDLRGGVPKLGSREWQILYCYYWR